LGDVSRDGSGLSRLFSERNEEAAVLTIPSTLTETVGLLSILYATVLACRG
jgi:hypothetical protein